MTPLEAMALVNGTRLQFRDFAIERGYAVRGPRTYRFWIENLDGRKLTEPRTSSQTELDLAGIAEAVAKAPKQPTDKYGANTG